MTSKKAQARAETVALEVVDEHGAVIHRLELQPQNRSERAVERIIRGMLINMDRERYSVREATK